MIPYKIKSGELKRRICLLKPFYEDDGQGGRIEKFERLQTVWAKVMPSTASLNYNQEQNIYSKVVNIIMRYKTPITPSFILEITNRYGIEYYEVTEILNINKRNREMELEAELIKPNRIKSDLIVGE